ncbi:MAG: F420-dependent methylenetetrahydromethanopterin dehydrogenase [Candidatus Bathyarchaeota archaeon]|nr:MAG: F420-dependent methylenetetrahydromethanopterin dehydrogenase [Candidatus Bathyarchaeota archaeon]
MVQLGVLKIGCIGSAPLLEFILDERAERQDLSTRVLGTGASMSSQLCTAAAEELSAYNPDLAIMVSPNATLPGPRKAREILVKNQIPTIVISDSPTRKIAKELAAQGVGYIIPEAESMIGARREFLDPVEMALFNADIIKVLAGTGVINRIVSTIDDVITSIKNGENPTLPTLIIEKNQAINAARYANPYARAKAIAAHEISRRVASLNSEGCFVLKDWVQYTTIVTAAHEMMRSAAKLIDEAREIEKANNTVHRQPHAKNGTTLIKTQLIEKPKKVEDS